MKNARIAAEVFNTPHMIEPGYGRIFVSALARHGFNIRSLSDAEGIAYDATEVQALADDYERGGRKLFAEADGIAIIPIEGTLTHRYGHLDPHSGMTGYDGVQAKLEAAAADPAVRGIVLDINSPGGAVAGCFDLADQIYEARQSKPIWAVCDELACSAAYALASAATRIIAPRTAQIGSIGVLTMHVDQSKMVQDMGIDVTFIFAGDHKVDGNPFEPLPDDVKASVQADIDQVYDMFVDLVARNRSGMDAAAVRNTQARVYSAAEAVDIGLADAVMPTHKVLDAFHQSLYSQGPIQSIQRGASKMALSLFGRKPKAQAPSAETADSQTAEGQASALVDQLTAAGFAVQVDEHGHVAGLGAEMPDENGEMQMVSFGQLPSADNSEKIAAGTVPVSGENAIVDTLEINGRAPQSASLDALVELCSEHRCESLAKPLRDRGVTADQAEAIMADVGDIRDAFAAAFPSNTKAAGEMADKFIRAAHVEQQFGGAARSLLVELTAQASGEEIDHIQPADQNASSSWDAVLTPPEKQGGQPNESWGNVIN